MTNNTHGSAREGAGRPPKLPEHKFRYLAITIPPDLAEWLHEQPDGVSRTIQLLVAEAMKRHSKEPPA